MLTRSESIDKIEKMALRMRKNALKMALSAGANGAHLGGGFSMMEIAAALYGGVMMIHPENPRWEDRDRFIISKGHGVLAYYTALAEAGLIKTDDLKEFEVNGSFLPGHPYMNMDKGIEFSAGSLGMGLSLGIGVALVGKKKGKSYRTFVLMGDGECNEGTVWEAAMAAAHYKLGNLVAIVDKNKLQYDGESSSIMNLGDLAKKWESFGWNAFEADGHNVSELYDAFSKCDPSSDKPYVIIANTIKGKGVSFMEGNPKWHHSSLSKEQYDIAISELGGEV